MIEAVICGRTNSSATITEKYRPPARPFDGYSREIAAEIDGAELVLIADCGHFLFVEQPARFAEAVAAFAS